MGDLVRSIFVLALLLTGILWGCVAPEMSGAQAVHPPPGQLTMTFVREITADPACLEYSWVPTGQRHRILLPPGIPSASETDKVMRGTSVSNVQVYSRNYQNTAVPNSNWMF